jgi:hypothetical protein
MQTVTLSKSALAVFRVRAKGLRLPVSDERREAYRELADAGIMEPDGDDFRFTSDGWARREALLREAEERMERERFEAPDASKLSQAARQLLRRRLEGDEEVTDANRPLYRELVAARIMYPVSTWAGGPESAFRFTLAGWEHRDEWIDAGANARRP